MNRKIRLFRKTKTFLFAENLPKHLKSDAFPQTKRFSFTQVFPYCYPKQPFSALHLPFAPSHNLLSAKNTAVLLLFALTPYAVTPEPRTDSKPFRRRFVRKTGFGSCRSENSAKIFFDRALNRPRESRGSQPSISLKHGRLAHVRSQFSLFRRSPTHKNLPLATFCTSERVFAVLFARRKKYQSVPSQGASRFSKPRFSSPQQRLRTNKIKTF